MKIVDAITELLFDPKLGSEDGREERMRQTTSETRTGFSRGGVAFMEGRILTREEQEKLRVIHRASLARTDF